MVKRETREVVLCKERGCRKPAKAAGRCWACYQRIRRARKAKA